MQPCAGQRHNLSPHANSCSHSPHTHRDQLVYVSAHHAQVGGVLLTPLKVLLTHTQALHGWQRHRLRSTRQHRQHNKHTTPNSTTLRTASLGSRLQSTASSCRSVCWLPYDTCRQIRKARWLLLAKRYVSCCDACCGPRTANSRHVAAVGQTAWGSSAAAQQT